MAKTKTSRRFKYHAAAKKRDATANDNTTTTNQQIDQQNSGDLSSAPIQTPAFNPFAGLKIDAAKLNLNLNVQPPEEWDRKTVVNIHKEVTKGKNKKEKAKMKRDLLLKKLEATRQLELDLKDRKRRQQTVITKDLKPLLDSLPAVDLLFHQASEETKKAQDDEKKTSINKVKKDRNSMKAKQKQKEMMKDLAVWKQVLEDSHFKKNPTETILNHVTFFVQKEYQDQRKSKNTTQQEM